MTAAAALAAAVATVKIAATAAATEASAWCDCRACREFMVAALHGGGMVAARARKDLS